MLDSKVYLKMHNDFRRTFFKTIYPSLKLMEKKRIKTLIITIIISLILIVVGLYLTLIRLADRISLDEDPILAIGLSSIGFGFGIWGYNKKKFESNIKRRVMNKVCSCFKNLKWSEGSYDKEDLFKKSNLICDEYSYSSYDDIFKGEYKSINCEIIEAKFIKEERVGRKNRFQIQIYSGVIVKLDMNKRFKGNTVIKPDTFMHRISVSNLRHTTLEDVNFEKKFDVFTNDEVEARYLITPSFMERLNNLKVSFSASKVECAFYDKYLLIGLHTNKDLFSVGSLINRVNDSKPFFTMFEEILSIFKLIDYFKLDQKIGL